MRRGTTCTVLPDREGRVTDPPLQTESGTVGRGLAPAAVFCSAKNRSPTAWAITPPRPSGPPSLARGASSPPEGGDGEGMPSPYMGDNSLRPSGIHGIPGCDMVPLARSCRTVKGGSMTLPYVWVRYRGVFGSAAVEAPPYVDLCDKYETACLRQRRQAVFRSF